MRAEDLKLWSKGETQDPLVRQYQAAINKDNLIVFAFPVWWGTMPAVLKGFCDKVLLPGWAYRHGETGEMIGLLTTKKAIVISTMETPADVFKSYYNDPVEGAFLKDTLQTCGIKVLHHFQIDRIISGGRAYTDAKLHEITQFIESDEILLV